MDFYSSLFKKDEIVFNCDLEDVIFSSVMAQDNYFVVSSSSSNEIQKWVFSMDDHNAPSSNGFFGAFFHACWDFIHLDVEAVLCSFFTDGVRQGDPLSSLLFWIAENYFSCLLNHSKLKLMPFSRGSVAPTHLLYAHDVLLFCNTSAKNVKVFG